MEPIAIPQNCTMRLTAMSFVPDTLTFRAMIRRPGGLITPWSAELRIPTALVRTAATVPVPDGEMMSSSVTSTNTGLFNTPTTYARAALYYGDYALGHLISQILGGYLRGGLQTGLPHHTPETVFQGNNGVGWAYFADPAPGVGMSMTVGTWGMERIQLVRCQLITDATVINRQLYFSSRRVLDPSVGYPALTTIAASSTRTCQWSYATPVEIYFAGGISAQLPLVEVAPGDSLYISVLNIQAGDQLTLGLVVGRQWLNC